MTYKKMLQEISAWLSFNHHPSKVQLLVMKKNIDELLEREDNSDYAVQQTSPKLPSEIEIEQYLLSRGIYPTTHEVLNAIKSLCNFS